MEIEVGNPAGVAARPLRVCLAASGGGHLRQLLDLSSAWEAHKTFFVTESTALGRSFERRARFVPHFALGQARRGAGLRMALSALQNAFQSARIVLGERPDVVISTGAGAVFFTVLWARLLGARIILIESFARFASLSAFARIAGRLAHYRFIQSAALLDLWPGAELFDPLRILDTAPPPKDDLLFATVGATLPFPRLTETVAALKQDGSIPEEVLIQRGAGVAAPEGAPSVETLPFAEMLATMRRARIVVCHGGTGSLVTALREGCRVIAMPRRSARGEHYDDHQSEIVDAFRSRGLIDAADDAATLSRALRRARTCAPVVATIDHTELTARLSVLLAGFAANRGRRVAGPPPWAPSR